MNRTRWLVLFSVLLVWSVVLFSVDAVLVYPSQDAALLLVNPDTNYGSSTGTTMGYYTAPSQEERTVMQFDLSAYVGTVVNSATLYMYRYFKYGSSSFNADIHRLTQPWDEAEVTWNSYETGQSWSTPGGDYDGTASATTLIPGSGYEWYSWDVTDLVQDWVDGTSVNYGLLAKQQVFGGGTYSAFYTREQTGTTSDPYIDLNIVPEANTFLLLGFGFLTVAGVKKLFAR
ncbi:MAG: DNRLRE domain-containing protein [Verrucomicrobia bacterium]|nr:DNRLRE domain-containing protein [Verrucomicrobiota bacterium]